MVLTFTLLVLAVHSVMSQEPVSSSAVPNNMGGKKDVPMALYLKAHSYLKASKVFGSCTLEDTIQFINEIYDWEAPRELTEKFPYYLSGYDYEDRPVWIAEVGKYNVREQIERGEEATQNLTKYLFQGGLRKLESLMVKDTPTREVRQIAIISDYAENIHVPQTTHTPTVNYALKLLLTYNDFIRLGLAYAIVVNQDYLTFNGFESIKHLFGPGQFDKWEFFGSDKERLKTALKKRMPESAIPTWYGGSKDYKPLAVYG